MRGNAHNALLTRLSRNPLARIPPTRWPKAGKTLGMGAVPVCFRLYAKANEGRKGRNRIEEQFFGLVS